MSTKVNNQQNPTPSPLREGFNKFSHMQTCQLMMKLGLGTRLLQQGQFILYNGQHGSPPACSTIEWVEGEVEGGKGDGTDGVDRVVMRH